MPQKAAPTFRYFIDHALTVEMKAKSVIKPINDPSFGNVCTEEITTWTAQVYFGSTKRALFRNLPVVTFHGDPDTAVMDLLRALDESIQDQYDTNAVQYDWIHRAGKAYDGIRQRSSAIDVPGAEIEVLIGDTSSGRVPCDRSEEIDILTGEFVERIIVTGPPVLANAE